MQLHNLSSSIPKKARKRKGRGNATGNGTFAGRGCNGQNSRSGGGVRVGFEGGQTPLVKRMPKNRGFRNPRRIESKVLNVCFLDENFLDNDKITLEILFEKKFIHKNDKKVKILGEGKLSKKLIIASNILLSKSAKDIITNAGGQIEKADEKK